MEHLRLWIDIGGGREREKRERKKEINSTRLYRIGSFEEGQRESRCFEPSFVEGELMKLGSGYSNNGCNVCAPLGRKSSRTGGTNGGTERKSMEIRVPTLETFPMEYPRIEFRFASHRSWIDEMEFIIVSELENNFPSKTRACLVSLRN